MALQIAQWNLTLNLTGIPANRAYSPVGSNSSLILPTQKNVLVKKIGLDSIYNQPGDICIIDYTLLFNELWFNGTDKIVDKPLTTTGLTNTEFIQYPLSKKIPIINVNRIFGGLLFTNSVFSRNNIILNNSSSAINSTLSFLLSIYYEN
jgi:hypothetical protein